MVEVIPIAATAIDWNLYLTTARQLLARSITQELDNRWMKVGDLGSFVCTLGEMVAQGVNPIDCLRDGGSLLDHAHCAFMVLATMPVTFELMQESRLLFTSVPTVQNDILVSIVSANLTQIRDAVINCSIDRVSTNVRMFANKLMSNLDKSGLSNMFVNYSRTIMPDRTLKLVEIK